MDDIGFWDIIVYAIAGLIIGALARLILPGKQSMSWGLTMVIGVVSAIIGGILWNAVFSGNEGVAWIGSLIVAIVIIVLYERVAAKRGGGSA
ncbi:MAG: GlsB/YeaQ/YmgE family stress response membrane protein [Actinomycetota bacterium]